MRTKTATKIVEAHWLYDQSTPMTVQIFKLNYDYWFDLDEGYNEDGATEKLNQDGEQYVVLNNCPIFEERKKFPFFTSLDLEDAKEYAEKTVSQRLDWQYL